MKKVLFFATALIALASCTNNDFVGDAPTPTSQDTQGAIVFGSGLNAVTRDNYVGPDAAAKLNNLFTVEGVKSNGTISEAETVFDNYNVKYLANTANTTLSNTANWEYVAQTKNANATIAQQTIKYWDYLKSQYDFIAYSVGTATLTTGTPASGQLKVSAIDAKKMNGVETNDVITDGAYTIEGAADDLKKAYIADLVTAYRDPTATSDYQKTVQFKFRALAAKARIALYETVPGYSVKDVVFYTNETTKDTEGKAAHLFTNSPDVFNGNGKYIVYFPTTGSSNKGETDYNKAHVKFVAATTDGGTSTVLDLGALDATNKFVAKEIAETPSSDKLYIGRFSSQATYAGTSTDNYYTVVLPNETGAALNLKVDYTLISTDGSGETIKVTGATAQVPAVYAAWKSGYAYTYLFKISENTDGKTNPSLDPVGLYPITFDAVVTETDDGVQETITTVSDPSITTYAKGEMVTAKNEYQTGANIYVVVEGAPALTVGTNANLYTVTLDEGAAQTINEESVANALVNGTKNNEENPTTWTLTDANTKSMVVTKATGLTAITEIAAADSPDGNAITVNGAKFTPSAAGTYVFEYINGTKKYYKIIQVVAP
jgi:hypothetical protein